jgi:hypothetical protein
MERATGDHGSTSSLQEHLLDDFSSHDDHNVVTREDALPSPPESVIAPTPLSGQPSQRANNPKNGGGSGSADDKKPLGSQDQVRVVLDPASVKRGNIYAGNKPKIVLEILSARSALIILIITYLVFIFGFSIDAYNITNGFGNSNAELYSTTCESQSITTTNLTTSENWGCLSGDTWNSTVVNLKNVISVQLNVEQFNFSGLFNDTSDIFKTIYFDVSLYACFVVHGCGDTFTDNPNDNGHNVWHQVLYLDAQPMTISKQGLDANGYSSGGVTNSIFEQVFQNQETTPDHGLVRAYFTTVHYYDNEDDKNFLVSTDPTILNSITYTLFVATRPDTPDVRTVALIVLVAVTLFTGVFYVGTLSRMSGHIMKWLPEQRWVIAYLFIVFFFQNIIYCSIYWMENQPRNAVYASYIFDGFGQAGLCCIWLIFSDSIARKELNRGIFYVPKIFFGCWMFLVGAMVTTFQFPSVSTGPRSQVEAVVNWPHDTQTQFVVFSMMYMILLWLFVIRWYYLLWVTGRRLRDLPYMNTRYMQLSYRFFLLQATLVTLFYMFEYGYVGYRIAYNAINMYPNAVQLANDINILLREQSHLFGKTLFLTVYALILAFIFLPAEFILGNEDGLATNLASTYVITVAELKPLVKSRRRAIRRMGKLKQSVFRIVDYKAEVFCADLALTLCNLSFEIYYDIKDKLTASGFGHAGIDVDERYLDVEKFGYTVIDSKYDDEHDTFCVIVKHEETQHLAVIYRGSSSKKHWKDNLNYAKMENEFTNPELNAVLHEIDQLDGLDCRAEGAGESAQTIMGRLAQLSSGFGNSRGELFVQKLRVFVEFLKFTWIVDTDLNLDSDSDSGDEEERNGSRRSISRESLDGGEAEYKRNSSHDIRVSERRTSFTAFDVGTMMTGVTDTAVDMVEGTSSAVTMRLSQVAAKAPALRKYVKAHIHRYVGSESAANNVGNIDLVHFCSVVDFGKHIKWFANLFTQHCGKSCRQIRCMYTSQGIAWVAPLQHLLVSIVLSTQFLASTILLSIKGKCSYKAY